MNQMNINFGALIRNVAVDMYGAQVGQEVTAVYGHKNGAEQVLVLERHPIGDHTFAYLVQGKTNPNYIGCAMSYKDGTVLVDNARVIGSTDPAFHVGSFAQAKEEVWHF